MKPKGKARGEGLELIANATLKLKAGVHYALIGRNGTGKSSELFMYINLRTKDGILHLSWEGRNFRR